MTKLTKTEKLLGEVAIVVPRRRNLHSYAAYVPWDLVERIRTHLTELGVDWKDAQRKYEAIKGERNPEFVLRDQE